MIPLRRFWRRAPPAPHAALFGKVADAARDPLLYAALGVPDTVEGRFESVALHLILMLRRLRALPPPADAVAQALVDEFFRQLDASLRELGVGDLGVPKRMKRLAEAFYGRAGAYDALLQRQDGQGLAAALGRNLLGRDGQAPPELAGYVLACESHLTRFTLAALFEEGPVFPSPRPFVREEADDA